MDTEKLESHLGRITRDGFTVLEDAFDADFAAAIQRDLARLAAELGTRPGANPFEGERTLRIYNLLAHGELYQRIPVHEDLLGVVEGVLDRGCLVSTLSSIDIGPGETAQPIHADDQLMPVPKPHPALVCNSMWAITDFTEANGATRVVPGSHLSEENPAYGADHPSVPAELERGSILVWHGSLWHGGGANRTNERRVGIAMNYCAGYIRQQENQQLGIPREVARTFPPRLRELVGYSVYNHLIGHIDKRSPEGLLDGDGELRTVWERVPRS